MPKTRPTLFATPMVQAIGSDLKSKTRRVLKNVPEWIEFFGVDESTPEGFITGFGDANTASSPVKKHFKNPYGGKGDRLWVRETWRAGFWSEDFDLMVVEYKAGGSTKRISPHEAWGEVRAEALWQQLTDEQLKIERNQLEDSHLTVPMKWRPSIFMPRKACRTILEITDLRVERLCDITEEDAIAEGAQRFSGLLPAHTDGQEPQWSMEKPESIDQCDHSAKAAFLSYWDKLNEKRGHGTKTSPWAWVVSFKILDGES